MKFGLVVVYDGEEAKLLGKEEAGVVKISYEHDVLKVIDPRESMLCMVRGLANMFERGLSENRLD